MRRRRRIPASHSAGQPASPERGELLARPTSGQRPVAATQPDLQPGIQRLGLSTGRDGLLYVPPQYDPGRPAMLVLSLHGAGGNAEQGISLLQTGAVESNFFLLAPDSRDRTWDFIVSDYGPDVAYIDRALEQVLSRYNIDPSHLAISGFSDGASYALSLGLSNGDLFSHVIAFSPGFMVPARIEGAPRIFISHGTHDSVLPIDRCSRRIVPQLERANYEVTYVEFDGSHTLPADIARQAIRWFQGNNS